MVAKLAAGQTSRGLIIRQRGASGPFEAILGPSIRLCQGPKTGCRPPLVSRLGLTDPRVAGETRLPTPRRRRQAVTAKT